MHWLISCKAFQNYLFVDIDSVRSIGSVLKFCEQKMGYENDSKLGKLFRAG